MTETTDIAALEAQIEQARRAEREQQAAADREARERDIAYRRHRLASYDRAALAKQSRETWQTFLAAVAADPVFTALADAQAARWHEYFAATSAYSDAKFLAQVDGTNPPPNPGRGEPPAITPETLLNAVSNLVAERVEEHRARVDEAHAAAVFGAGLTPEQSMAIEQQAEAARRREAARSLMDASTDVTGMTEAERARRGLPPGRREG